MDRPERLIESPYENHYGAARRCESALLHVCQDSYWLAEAFYQEWGEHWDRQLGRMMDEGTPEEQALRLVISRCITAYEPSCW